MTALPHRDDDSQSRRTNAATIDHPPEQTTVRQDPGIHIGRIVIGTGVATLAAFAAMTVGIPVLAATAIGAGVGGGAVAALAAHAAPLRH
jgi:hypothetical protein